MALESEARSPVKAPVRHGRQGVPLAERVSAKAIPAPSFHSTVPVTKRSDRRRDHCTLPHVGDRAGTMRQCNDSRNLKSNSPRTQQRRLRSRFLPGRPDRKLFLRHGRRLPGNQVRPQSRWTPRRRSSGKHRDSQLRNEGRARRLDDRQRDVGRRAQCVLRELPI